MEQRIRFVKDARTGLYTMSELCERYNVSRKTGYKWRPVSKRKAWRDAPIAAARPTAPNGG